MKINAVIKYKDQQYDWYNEFELHGFTDAEDAQRVTKYITDCLPGGKAVLTIEDGEPDYPKDILFDVCIQRILNYNRPDGKKDYIWVDEVDIPFKTYEAAECFVSNLLLCYKGRVRAVITKTDVWE